MTGEAIFPAKIGDKYKKDIFSIISPERLFHKIRTTVEA